MKKDFQKFYALTTQGLELAVDDELKKLNFKNVQKATGGVWFETDWEGCYLANLMLRSASRVLWPLKTFEAKTGEDIYHQVKNFDFTHFIGVDATLMVDSIVKKCEMRDQRFVALKAKDAIVDQFRDKFGARPDVNKDNPDLRVWIRGLENQYMLAIDTTGEPLFKRGYRVEQVPAPIKEHGAAGLLWLSGWDKRTPIVDLMCGSGTFLIEAALAALNIAPGTMRKDFAFKRLAHFDQAAFKRASLEAVKNEKSELDFKLYGFDIDRKAVKAAKANVREAGLEEYIEINRSSVELVKPPVESGMIIVNPPYGERLKRDEPLLRDVYQDLAYALKNNFKGWTAWVLSPRRDMTQLLGMKYTQKYQVMNGQLACDFLKYNIFKTP